MDFHTVTLTTELHLWLFIEQDRASIMKQSSETRSVGSRGHILGERLGSGPGTPGCGAFLGQKKCSS